MNPEGETGLVLKKKLVLKREHLRNLTASEMQDVDGASLSDWLKGASKFVSKKLPSIGLVWSIVESINKAPEIISALKSNCVNCK